MKRRNLLPLAAVLVAGAVSPALAAWDRIGSVDFSQRDTHDSQYGNFGGSVEALALQARGSDLRCRSVTATFGNGRTRQVFRGNLPQGQNVTIDLPGRERRVSRLDFDCMPKDRGRASVDIVADVGRYQDEWRRSPDWQRNWSHVFNWDQNDRRGPGGNDRNDRNDRNGPYVR
jgi:transposase